MLGNRKHSAAAQNAGGMPQGNNAEAAGTQATAYRKAKTWQIILYACNAFIGMAVYSLIGMASYSANIGYGITVAMVGVILTCTRILDAVTDPLLAFIYDRVNTGFGKIRILIIAGWLVEASALLGMFSWFSSKGHGIVTFVILYIVYVLGYTCANMTAQTIPPLLTNDPKQRPMVGVWTTIFNYLVPLTLGIVTNVVLLPRFGGTYNQEFLTAVAYFDIAVSALGVLLVCIGVTPFDKPENFRNLGARRKEHLHLKDMVEVLRDNKPLQCYIVAAASDKIAQQTASQAIVVTLLAGILIGNMGLSTILNAVGMVPSIIFAIIGAKYAGRFGNKEATVTWTKICMVIAVLNVIFLAVIDTKTIATFGATMIIYVVFLFILNGAKMCVTTANVAFMSDIIDYELDRSGRFVPAVVTGTYSLIDKLVSSFSALIATGCIALIGYTKTMPQPGDPSSPKLFWMTMFLNFGLAIIGWICTLIAMRRCPLDKAAMAEVQERIANKKAAEKEKLIAEELQ